MAHALYPAAVDAVSSVLGNFECPIDLDVKSYSAVVLQLVIDGFRTDGYELHRFTDPENHLAQSTTLPHMMLRRSLNSEEEHQASTGPDLILNVVLVFVCVLCAGFASGLTQGLLSLDYLEMKIKAHSGTPQEKTYAERVLPIISNHHLLLVTLMLWNASATEALPIFLNKLVPEYAAIIISVTLVLIVGEIIPASILTGPHQLRIAANLVPLVYAVLVIFFPVAFPISKTLDWIIGHEEGFTVYNRKELAAMMKFQHEEGQRISTANGNHAKYHSLHDGMRPEEVSIIHGALQYRDIKVSDVMTHKKNVFQISINETLSYKTIYKIFKSGYSRIPIYDEDDNHIVSIILTKDLIFIDPEDDIPVRNFVQLFGRKPTIIWYDQKLGETLALFRNERAHLAIVRDVESHGDSDPYYIVVGIITMEDVIEEILGTEIEDETDEARMDMIHSHPSSQDICSEANHELVPLNNPASSDPGNHHHHTAWNTKLLRDMDFARLKALHDKMAFMNKDTDLLLAVIRHLDNHAPLLKDNLLQRARYYFSSMATSIALGGRNKSSNADEGATNIGEDNTLLLEFMKQQAEVISITRKIDSHTGSNATLESITSTTDIGLSVNLDNITSSDESAGSKNANNSKKNVSLQRSHYSTKLFPTVYAEDILYRYHRISTSCLIITEGNVKVIPGKSKSEISDVETPEGNDESSSYLLGPWSILGQEALLTQEGTYIPDFTAIVDSPCLKFVRISSFTVTAHSAHESGWSNLMKKKHEDLFSSHNVPK